MTALTSSAFDLPDRLAAKGAEALIARDEAHFRAIAETLAEQVAELTARLDETRRAPGGQGQAAMDRDLEVHRLTQRLKSLQRFSLEVCLGRVVTAADPDEPTYVGRLGLTDRDGKRLLVDWRSPAAEPFFGATHAHPEGLLSRRRYRWSKGRVTDYWDEVFTADGLADNAALDDQSAFIAMLGSSRTSRMRDVLGTIQADQDAIIRADSRGALVVDGGPGTGKTVVALHRTAYLLHADPRLGQRRGGVLVVGPHRPYLAYVADVLPSLGEEGVQTCTIRDLVRKGASAGVESVPEVVRLKSAARLLDVIEPAVRLYEEPPTHGLDVETPWADLWMSATDWVQAFDAPDPGTPHNEAREQIWDEICEILIDKYDGDEATDDQLRRAIRGNAALRDALGGAWPMLTPTDLVADLWSVPAYLRRCAPWLTPEERSALKRSDPYAWTDADLPLLDAASRRLGDPDVGTRQRRQEAEAARERERMSLVVDDLLAADHDGEGLATMLVHHDLKHRLVADEVWVDPDPDLLAGPFAHVVVDEAQELTDAQWRMLISRCPSRSFTIVGDRAQARHGFSDTWFDHLAGVGLDDVTLASLTINYRTPSEVMAEAEPVIRSVLPDANVPTSIRSSGVPVHHGRVAERDQVLAAWLEEHEEGVACVIGDPTYAGTARIRSLTPELAKGLEFDLVVLVDPDAFDDGIVGAVDRYVAMTRATHRLVVLQGD